MSLRELAALSVLALFPPPLATAQAPAVSAREIVQRVSAV